MFAGNSVAAVDADTFGLSGLEHALSELTEPRPSFAHVRSILCPMPNVTDPSWGVGFVLGGMRGSGTVAAVCHRSPWNA